MPQERSLSGETKEKSKELHFSSYYGVFVREGTLLSGSLIFPCPISEMKYVFFPLALFNHESGHSIMSGT